MKYRMIILRVVSVLILASLVFKCFGCAPEDPSVIAGKVAKEWANNNVDSVSESIIDLVAQGNPVAQMAMSVTVKNEIKRRIVWEYSTPVKLGEERYKVIATAYTVIDLPVLGSYKASLNYNLEIDTEHRQVISADMNPSSFALSKQ